MPSVDLTEQEWGQLMNILGTTKEHPWVVTNPLLMKVGEQLRATTMQKHTPNPQQINPTNGQEAHHE